MDPLEHLEYSRQLAIRFIQKSGRWQETDDYIAVAAEALLEACNSYKPGKKTSERTWVYSIVNGRLKDYARKEMMDNGARGSKGATGERFAYVKTRVFGALEESGDEDNTPKSFLRVEEGRYEDLEDCMTDAQVLREFFTVLSHEWDHDPMRMKIMKAWLEYPLARDAGKACGVSESRVSQVVREALALAKDFEPAL